MSDETFLVLPRQPSREDAPSVPGCSFGSGRHGCRLRAPSLGSGPPERPTLASMLLQCQPFLAPHPVARRGNRGAELCLLTHEEAASGQGLDTQETF